MSPTLEQEDRRSRRRFALLWCGSIVAVVALTAAAVLAVHDGSTTAVVDADGTGTAPVLESPPVDVEPPTDLPTTTARPLTTAVPSLSSLARTAEGGAALAPTPHVSSGAALVPPRTHGVSLLLTSTLSEPLRPGFERVLTVTVRNPNPFPVDLYRVDVRVDPPPAIGCLAEWVNTSHYRYGGGTPRRIAGQSTSSVNLAIELVDLVDVDQNACQNTAFPLRLSGLAVDAA